MNQPGKIKRFVELCRDYRFDAGGFSLVEVMVTLVILAVAVVPMLRAFTPSLSNVGHQERVTVCVNQARSTLNRVLSLDYAVLKAHEGDPVDLISLFGSAAEANRESFVFNSKTMVPVVAISNAGGADQGLLEIRVTATEVTLTSLSAEI
ncbi:MAG: prepilin-type N-terminal cleavage/methylation domain-containing protein [Desulfobacteraceae bacterium]|nr:prepilin-type N-terminal cleavage/methylation domain-containing protein [Desulfobacteraceae bacterium]